MPTRRHIVFIISSLGPGGTERVFAELANYVAREDRVTLLVVTSVDVHIGKILDPRVEARFLEKKRMRFAVFSLAAELRRLHPTIIISALPHVNIAVIAARRISRVRCPLVISERNLPSPETAIFGRIILLKLRGWIYRYADAVVAVSHGVKASLIRDSGVNPAKITVIRNQLPSVDPPRDAIDPWQCSSEVGRLISVGSLSKKKNYEFLIKALQIVAAKREVLLVILGQGAELRNLQALSRDLELKQNVVFGGFVEDVVPWVHNADVFVMSSIVEGDSNSMLEAVALNKLIVCTEAKGSSAETLGGYTNAWIVPDGDLASYSDALDIALDWRVKKRLGVDHFSRPDAFNMWLALLNSLLQRRDSRA